MGGASVLTTPASSHQHSSAHRLSRMAVSSSLRSLLLFTLSLSAAHALVCFTNDASGNVMEESRPEWEFCSLIPFAGEGGKGRLAGVGAATENLTGFHATFSQNSALYQVLATCILEKYDFGAINPALGPAPEFMFRCLCNTDRCNQAETFGAFLASNRH